MNGRMNGRSVWVVGACALLVVGAMVFGGPITPPGGAIASTGKTLDEIFNKIPAGGSGDGRTAIPGGTSTVTINQPGSYVLTGNIVVSSGNAVAISASNVTIDLNGYRLSSQSTGTSSIPLTITVAGATNVVIRNGSTSGGVTGIVTGSNNIGLLIEDIDIYNAKITGIQFSNGAIGCVVRRCRIFDTGSTTAFDVGLAIRGIVSLGSIGTRIENCTVSRLFFNGTGAVTFHGIQMGGSANMVEGCHVFDDGTITGTGIDATGSVYRNNTVTNFNVKYSGGTDGGGNF